MYLYRKFILLTVYCLYNISFNSSLQWLALAQNNQASTTLPKPKSHIGSSSSASLSSGIPYSQSGQNFKSTSLPTQSATHNDSKSSSANFKVGGHSSSQSKPSTTPVKPALGSSSSPVGQPANQPNRSPADNQQPKAVTQSSSGRSYGASSHKPGEKLTNGTSLGTGSQNTHKQQSVSAPGTSGRPGSQASTDNSQRAKPPSQPTSGGGTQPGSGSCISASGGSGTAPGIPTSASTTTPRTGTQTFGSGAGISITPAARPINQPSGGSSGNAAPRTQTGTAGKGQTAPISTASQAVSLPTSGTTYSGTLKNLAQPRLPSTTGAGVGNQTSSAKTSGSSASSNQPAGVSARTPNQQDSNKGGTQPAKSTSEAQGATLKASLSPTSSPKPASDQTSHSTEAKPVSQSPGGAITPSTTAGSTATSPAAKQPAQLGASTTPSSNQSSAKSGKQTSESQDLTPKTPASGQTTGVTTKTGQAAPKPADASKAGGQPISGSVAAVTTPVTPAGQPAGGTSGSAGGQGGSTSTTPPPIPRRYGDPKAGQESLQKTFALSGSRTSGRPTITGRISVGSVDSKNLTQTQRNTERWVRPTAVLRPGLHSMSNIALNLEISTMDTSDSSKKVINDTNSYKISHKRGSTLYKFNENAKCVLIRCDDKDVWKHVQGKGKDDVGTYPKCLVVVSKFIFVVFDNYFKLYKKVAGLWKQLYEAMPSLEQVDIKHTNKKVYDYSKDSKNKVYVYTAKDGVLFNSVKRGKSSCGCGSELAIWDTKFPEEYATRIIRKGSGKEDKKLCVYYLSGNYSVFFKRKGGKTWEDKTSDKFFPSDFRFYTFNEKEKQYEALEQANVEVTLDDYVLNYRFVNGAKCHGIRCGNIKLWNHDKSKFGDDYPHQMSLNMLNHEVTVRLKGLVFVYEYTGGELAWKLSPPDFSSHFSSRLTVVTVDENGSNSSENDSTRYEFGHHKTGLMYKIKENSKFVEVKAGTKSLWKHAGKSGHPTVLYYDTKNSTLFLKFKDTVGICNSGDSRTVKLGEQAPNTADLTLVTIDDNNNLKENKILDSTDSSNDASSKQNQVQDFTKENMDQAGRILRYRFGDKVKCVQLKCSGKSLWNHQMNKHGKEFPTEIIINLMMATMTLNFDAHLHYLFTFDGEKWQLESENNLFDFFLGKFFIVTADDAEGTNSRENDELEFSTERQNSFLLMFLADDSKCTSVKFEDQMLWSFNQKYPDSFARAVSCSPRLGTLAIDTDAGSLTFRLENGRWKQGYDPLNPLHPSEHPQGFTVVTLDGENRLENDVSQYSVYDRRNDYFLYHFHEGVKCVEFRFGERKIWRHQLRHKTNYPESITVDFSSNSVEVEIGDKTHTYVLFKDE